MGDTAGRQATERDVALDGGRTTRLRQVGDRAGPAVVYFHGTPGFRLDLAFGDDIAIAAGVHLVSFDRPGYGASTPTRFASALDPQRLLHA